MKPSIFAIWRGVNARDTSDRMAVCSGGSMKMIWPVPLMSDPIISSTVPRAELNVVVSRCAFSTSSNRLSAQKSYRSLRYTGASSRRRRHTGCGAESSSSSNGSQYSSVVVSIVTSTLRRSDLCDISVVGRSSRRGSAVGSDEGLEAGLVDLARGQHGDVLGRGDEHPTLGHLERAERRTGRGGDLVEARRADHHDRGAHLVGAVGALDVGDEHLAHEVQRAERGLDLGG